MPTLAAADSVATNVLLIVFAVIYFYDKARGGYQEEVLIQDEQTA